MIIRNVLSESFSLRAALLLTSFRAGKGTALEDTFGCLLGGRLTGLLLVWMVGRGWLAGWLSRWLAGYLAG